MAQEGLEPSASLVLSESGLPIAYRAGDPLPLNQYPGWESNPQGSSLARVPSGCRRHSACPFPSPSSRSRFRTCVLPVNSRALVPARTPPESSRQTVGMAGFEPASPAPEAGGLARLSHIPSRLALRQVPSGSRTRTSPWQGGRLPLHHGHDRYRPTCQRTESTE